MVKILKDKTSQVTNNIYYSYNLQTMKKVQDRFLYFIELMFQNYTLIYLLPSIKNSVKLHQITD